MTAAVVRAAGGVLWRTSEAGGIEVAVIHRPAYDDWSLPKGKALEGEHPLACARREVKEETGYDAVVGRPLGSSRYLVRGRSTPAAKQVDWWALQATSGAFQPSREVDQLRWLPPQAALRRIAGSRGTAALRRFMRASPQTRTLLLVRNAKAAAAPAWEGMDAARPLDRRGREQVDALTPVLAAYRPHCVAAAAPVRCVETVSPVATTLGLPVEIEPALAGPAHALDPGRARTRVLELVEDASAVVCGQREVVLPLVRLLTGRRRVSVGPGSTWAVSLDQGRVVGADYWTGQGFV